MAGLEKKWADARHNMDSLISDIHNKLSQQLANESDSDDYDPEDDLQDLMDYWSDADGILDKMQDEINRLES